MGRGVAFAQTPDFSRPPRALGLWEGCGQAGGICKPVSTAELSYFSPKVDTIETSKTDVILSYVGGVIGIGEA